MLRERFFLAGEEKDGLECIHADLAFVGPSVGVGEESGADPGKGCVGSVRRCRQVL